MKTRKTPIPLVEKITRLIRSAVEDPIRRLILSLVSLLVLNIVGTIAYMVIEGWDVIDAFYMTVITIGTVGFGEVRTLSPAGRVFTVILIYLGIGTATTALTNAAALAVGPLLWESLKLRRMRNMIDQLNDHYIVCGYGRMGRQIIRDLQAREEPFVLVDMNESLTAPLLEEGIPFIVGDATDDDVLYAAGLRRAKGLVASLSSDAANIMTVLTARELNSRLFIVARVVRSDSESKLQRAGANRVVNPYQIGGHRIALSLLRPAVHDFLDHIFHFGDTRNIDIGQVVVLAHSDLDGKTIATSGLRDKYNVSILGIREPTGKLEITPNPNTQLRPNSQLIVIGPPASIYELERKYERRT
ncbi:MAG: potassium channel family protein [Anaerolineae bacterium]